MNEDDVFSNERMKTCNKCKTEKTINEFHKMTRNKSGVQSKCKMCASRSASERYRKDPAAFNAKSREWASKNPKKAIAIDRAWYAANKQQVSDKCRAWRIANPESSAAHNRARRARKAMACGFHTEKNISEIFDGQRGLCANCNKKLFKSGKNKYHVDHVIALARGGSNWPDNLQCLCPSCNMSKGAKDPIAWAQENGRLL